MAFNGQRVLVGPRDAPLGCNVLSCHAHVDGVKRVVQRAHHHVDHFAVAHARAKARGQAGVGCAAHVFGAATNGHVGVAQQDALAGRDDGLQARTAQAVDVEGRCAFGTAAVDRGHARQIHVAGFGVDHVAKDHMANVFAVDAGTRQ